MPRTPVQIVRLIEAIGWRFLRQKGIHRIYVHDTISGVIVVPMHKGDLKIGTERDILKWANLL